MPYLPNIFKNSPNENKEEKSGGSTKRKRRGSSSLDLNQSSEETDPQLDLEPNSAGTKHSKASEPLHDGDVQHHEEQDYSCKFCTKTFSNKQALGGHQNAHKIEKVIQKRGLKVHEDHFGHPGNNSSNGMTSFAFPNSFNQVPKLMSPPHHRQTMQHQMYAHDHPNFTSPMSHESGVIPCFLSPMSRESGVNPGLLSPKSHESGVNPGFISPKSHESGVNPGFISPKSHESGVNPCFLPPMTRESGVNPGFLSPMTRESGATPKSHEQIISVSPESGFIRVSRASDVMELGSFYKSSPSPQFLSFQNRMDQGASTSKGKSSTTAKNDYADNWGPSNDAESKQKEDELDLTLKL